jgi:uncharacterized protein
MVMLLTPAERARLGRAERAPALPLPSRIVSNGEYTPPPQSRRLKDYEARLLDGSAKLARKLAMPQQSLLRQPIGFGLAFASLNQAFGAHFQVGAGEASDLEAAAAYRA